MKFVKKHYVILSILLIGLLLRVYKFEVLFQYNHDQDLLSWFVKDILENKHLRLIGQETSNPGVFIGPLFYYLLIPFYILSGMDPIGGIWFSVISGCLAIASFYFVFSKIFNKNVGLIAAFIYSVSSYTVFTDREVVPTQPAMMWTVWYLYAVFLILKGRQKWGFLLAGILLGLIWHINLALGLLVPLILVAWVFSREKLSVKYVSFGIIAALLIASPVILFELKHNFQQVHSVVAALTTDKAHVQGTGMGLAKLDRTFQLINKNTTSLFFPFLSQLHADIVTIILIICAAFIYRRKLIEKRLFLIVVSWQLLFIIFFTLNPINLSEYYINGMNVIWIAVMSITLFHIAGNLKFPVVAYCILALFAGVQVHKTLTIPVDASGYIQRKAITQFIKTDSLQHNYPCVSVSYITDPGRDLGYRYFYYLEEMHVNQPKSGSPVYTIVFPHSKVDRIDKSFGALGLILPDYDRYSAGKVAESCSGQNANLTDPMFGFP